MPFSANKVASGSLIFGIVKTEFLGTNAQQDVLKGHLCGWLHRFFPIRTFGSTSPMHVMPLFQIAQEHLCLSTTMYLRVIFLYIISF